MTSIEKLVKIALAEVGVREEGGNNRGERIIDYQGATWLQPDPWPWCAAFVVWCIREWIKDPSVREALRLHSMDDANMWRPRTAGAWDLANWARKRAIRVLPDTATPKPGDIVLYDFSHCGIVVGVGRTTIDTVEGNTNGAGDRDSTTGDGVWRKTRPRSIVRSYIRLQ